MSTVSNTILLSKPKIKATYTFENFSREAMKVAKTVGACWEVRDAIREATETKYIVYLLEKHSKFIFDRAICLQYSQECADYLNEAGWHSQELFIDGVPTTRMYKYF